MSFIDKVYGFREEAKGEFPGRAELEIIHKLIDWPKEEGASMTVFLSAYEQVHMGNNGQKKATDLTEKIGITLNKIKLEAAGDENRLYDVSVIRRALEPLELAFRTAAKEIEKFQGEMIGDRTKERAIEFYTQLDKAIKSFIDITASKVDFNPE